MKLRKNIVSLILSLIEVLALTSSCVPVEYDTMGEIHGIVVQADNGIPIRGATVTLTPGLQSCSTDAAGEFLFSDCEVKQYSITAQAAGFETNGKSVTVVAGKCVEVIIELRLPEYE